MRMLYEDAIAHYQPIIEEEVNRVTRRSGAWRMEADDLRQECLLALWEAWPAWINVENPGGMCRVTCRNAIADYRKKMRGDALYSADNYGLRPTMLDR